MGLIRVRLLCWMLNVGNVFWYWEMFWKRVLSLFVSGLCNAQTVIRTYNYCQIDPCTYNSCWWADNSNMPFNIKFPVHTIIRFCHKAWPFNRQKEDLTLLPNQKLVVAHQKYVVRYKAEMIISRESSSPIFTLNKYLFLSKIRCRSKNLSL